MLTREFIVSALNGLLRATLLAIGAALVFSDQRLGYVIATMMVSILIAAIAGSLLHSLLRRIKIDPAIAGGLVLTKITDITGFFCIPRPSHNRLQLTLMLLARDCHRIK
jgi:magnesium transporter